MILNYFMKEYMKWKYSINNINLIFIPLVITLFLEILISIFLGLKNKYNYKKIILINVITNPLLNIINILTNLSISIYLSACFGMNMYVASNIQILILEMIVVFIETFYYYKYMIYEKTFILNFINNKMLKIFVYSLILNTISYSGGKLIHICLHI